MEVSGQVPWQFKMVCREVGVQRWCVLRWSRHLVTMLKAVERNGGDWVWERGKAMQYQGAMHKGAIGPTIGPRAKV